MRGLRTPESEGFEAFWGIVQMAARKRGAVFFLDSGEGRGFSTSSMEGEDCSGWLIPDEQADRFEALWITGDPGAEWDEMICFALWGGSKEHLSVRFEHY